MIIGVLIGIIYQLVSTTITVNIQATRLVLIETRLEQVQNLREDLARQREALNEIETQFCASDSRSNLTHANDLRTMAMLWEKVYGVRYPTDNVYYPVVCNRRATTMR